jgi:hypothetical protein
LGLQYVGIFIYADDVLLLCPSLQGLQRMVDNAIAFAADLNLKFNPNKTVGVRFGFGKKYRS